MADHGPGPASHLCCVFSVQYVKVGIVGGSDEVKICEQLGANGMLHSTLSLPLSLQCLLVVCQKTSNGHDPNAAKDQVDFFFAENGLVAYKEGKILATESLKTWLGEDKLKELLNYILHYVADLDIPIKRGTFIEFRNGMLNVSPIGRNCSQEERDEFERFDQGAGVRYNHHLLLQRHCFVMPSLASGSSSRSTTITMCLLH